MYGRDFGLYVMSPGLTVTEAKKGELSDWVADAFGASSVTQTKLEPGVTVEGVWRPGLYFDQEVLQGLGAAHSHKARELLILACTEIETSWKHYLRRANVNEPRGGFTTNDYVRLKESLFLEEFEIGFPRYNAVPRLRPFYGWAASNPTTSLDWYDAYNKTKHDRAAHFELATLLNCIKATAANIILFAVRFGPFRLFSGAGTLSALFNQTFSMELKSPDYTSFYAPLVLLPANQRTDRICFNSQKLIQHWTAKPFRI